MRIKNYNVFIYGNIFEKSGIMLETEELSRYIYKDLINKDIKENDKYIYNINSKNIEIIVDTKYCNKLKTLALFISNKNNIKSAKIYINLPLNEFSLWHEIAHFIRFGKLGEKIEKSKNKLLKSSKFAKNFIKTDKLDKLIELIYLCDDSEMNSYIHEIYSKINYIKTKNNLSDKNRFFKEYMNNIDFF